MRALKGEVLLCGYVLKEQYVLLIKCWFFYPDVTGGENFVTVDVLSQFHHHLMLTNNV
jgi:hypothetical protein